MKGSLLSNVIGKQGKINIYIRSAFVRAAVSTFCRMCVFNIFKNSYCDCTTLHYTSMVLKTQAFFVK
jgi:hypothetical protein